MASFTVCLPDGNAREQAEMLAKLLKEKFP